ncbi:MAG: prepilin-type N-terminal cleavage/methylation domain-containing protein [candidate division Zixibacteria bacterium]|nr:prepilin-type N-terminal cleavage/methylation domain-containing protein [candidate division Zixibacteria bacterium]
MLKYFRNDRKGFTLVEVLVVVIIIAVLAAIAVPIYLSYVESARAAEAQEMIGSILAASKVFQSRFGQIPSNYEEMERRNILRLDPLSLNRWTPAWQVGSVDGQQQIAVITLTSTGEMPGGAGKQVTYNAITGEYTPDSYGQ